MNRSVLRIIPLVLTSLLLVSTAVGQEKVEDPIPVLIVDGQNGYHGDWPKITLMMKTYLEETGKFKVDVYRSKFLMNGAREKEFPLDDGKEYKDFKEAKTDPDFKPDFSKYKLVVNNFGYNAAPWPKETQQAFEKFMKDGGGLVSVHAANNCFPQWKEYNLMTGLGGWGGRSQKSGPYVYYNDKDEIVRDDSDGKGGHHGPQHKFQIVLRNTDHPITNGMPSSFLHAQDELYEQLRGPALNMTILATAFASPEQKGSGRHEPLLIALDYEKGRVFHTTLGHAAYSCECVGFITTFLRGSEWAATGNVTIPVPKDFPTATETSVRKFDERGVEARDAEKAVK
ncbi:ThuA domain-containing protein [Mariniblastus fucicola]|uniref:Trehalose utilization n=1 Tax=Mariniblastus fucicola TaxID=980251 RepID=A0A5B9P4H8_9BACT|nr:ThuA domain-containing protein [Mariniblastus fucicola]QEG21174.1 Trehalose utilization [Mariniblastus fucicola]